VDARLHELHLQAGRVAGQERTCGKKQAYATEELAGAAAAAHNRWTERRHDVEPYPCAFCGSWHVGRIIPVELLEAMAKTSEPSETID
jgi:hypothetical protein